MVIATPLQPTLWRTCRVLANRNRLQICALLIQKPGQTVSAIAARLRLTLPVASQYLRALEARGLLASRRVGRRVLYRPATATDGGFAYRLAAALRWVFRRDANAVETLFKMATAFTHPRRIELFRALKHKPQTLEQIRSATDIPLRAVRRHLKKLEARKFVFARLGSYAVMDQAGAFGQELAREAAS